VSALDTLLGSTLNGREKFLEAIAITDDEHAVAADQAQKNCSLDFARILAVA